VALGGEAYEIKRKKLTLLAKKSVKTFPRQPNIFGEAGFFAFRLIPKEALTRSSCHNTLRLLSLCLLRLAFPARAPNDLDLKQN
jgi:hypothetical protein